MNKFWSKDLSALVYGRKFLLANPAGSAQFFLGKENAEAINSADFFAEAMADVAKNKTVFGRIGLVFDRKNLKAKKFIKNLERDSLGYVANDERAAVEKKLQIFEQETQVLVEMAKEGLADSVEFRRLARRMLRPLRHANCDTILFFDDILAEEKTRKILNQIVGTQKKIFFPVDYFVPQKCDSTARNIKFFVENEDEIFVKARAEKILRTQISNNGLS